MLAAGLSLTLSAAYYAWRTVDLRNSSQFDLTAQHTRADIERSVEAYVALMRGVAGFFAADTNVAPAQFKAFAHRLRLAQFYPGIQGIGYSARVLPEQEESFVAAMQEQGRTNFQIWPKLPRPELHTITLLEPETERNIAAIGFDMFTDPIRRRAMESACDNGRPAASGKVTLVQEIDEARQNGFLIYTPIYEGGLVPATLEERRRLLKGFAYCPFRMTDFVFGELDTNQLRQMTLRIYDGSSEHEENLLHESAARLEGADGWFTTSHQAELTLEVCGRPWTIVCSIPPVRLAGWWIPCLVLAAGSLLSLLFFAMSSSESRARHDAEAAAEQLRISEAALRDSENRMRLMIENAHDYAIFAMDLKGRIVSWNSGAERLFGYHELEIVGRSAAVVFTEEDRLAGAPEHELSTALSTGFARDDRWHLRKDGTRLFVSGTVRVITDEAGQRRGFIKIARDVTERLEAEARLRRERDFSAMILNSLPGIFYFFDAEGRWLRWNHNLETITGYSAEEIPRKLPVDFFAGGDRVKVAEAINEALREGETTVEASLLSRHREPAPFLFYGRRIQHDGKPCVMGMGVDISERKRAESELRDAQEQLKIYTTELEQRVVERTAHLRQSLQSLENLLYHVAHDLRAPLRSMASFTTLLMDDYASQLDDCAKDYARRIAGSAQFMDELVQDLLTYGHLTHANFTLSSISLEQHVDTVIEQLAGKIAARNARVEVERPLPVVRANPAVVNQIVLNLLDNALKFVPADRAPQIRIRAERNHHVRLWVEDNGIGIKAEYHDRIFRVFERLHAGDQFQGTGIGLAIVIKAAERVGGRAGVESQLGEGSRFWVEFQNAEPASEARQPGPVEGAT